VDDNELKTRRPRCGHDPFSLPFISINFLFCLLLRTCAGMQADIRRRRRRGRGMHKSESEESAFPLASHRALLNLGMRIWQEAHQGVEGGEGLPGRR